MASGSGSSSASTTMSMSSSQQPVSNTHNKKKSSSMAVNMPPSMASSLASATQGIIHPATAAAALSIFPSAFNANINTNERQNTTSPLLPNMSVTSVSDSNEKSGINTNNVNVNINTSSSSATTATILNSVAPFAMPPFPPSTSSINGSTNTNATNSSSNSSTHLLLRHPDAIPTLISLLSSPNREVHEQAMWILGSIAAGEGSNSTQLPNPPAGVIPNALTANISASGNNSGSNSIPTPTLHGNTACMTNPPNSSSSTSSSVTQAREQVLQAGVMAPLLACLEENPHNLSLQRIGSWALSNLVDVRYPQPSSSKNNSSSANNNNNSNSHSSLNSSHEINIKTLLPTLKRLLCMADAEVLSHSCWALSHLCDGPSSHISIVVSPSGGLVPRLVELLLHPSWRVTKPALRTIGNVVCAECVDEQDHMMVAASGEDNIDGGNTTVSDKNSGSHRSKTGIMIPVDYTEIILECGAVPRLKQLITHGNREIQKEACWTLSNIAAGAIDQIQAVIDSGAIAPLVKLASDPNTDQEVRSEACWVVLNATSCGSDSQIETLVREGCVNVLGVLLNEQTMVMMALEGLERVLQVEEGKEMQMRRIDAREDSNGSPGRKSSAGASLVSASLIEALEQHKNSAVSKRAGKIWKQHFISCALCHQSFSRHRSSEAHFCKECKCHVCSSCNCEIYHLSYQEEFWAANEEKTQAKTLAKKSKKNKKKLKKKKQKNNKQVSSSTSPQETVTASAQFQDNSTAESKLNIRAKESNNPVAPSVSNTEDDSVAISRSSSVSSFSEIGGSASRGRQSSQNHPPINELGFLPHNSKRKDLSEKSSSPSRLRVDIMKRPQIDSERRMLCSSNSKGVKINNKMSSATGSDYEEYDDDEMDDVLNDKRAKEKDYSDIDLVHYLEQTGSIIALSRLLDQLDDVTLGKESEKAFDHFDHDSNSTGHLELMYSSRTV